MTLFFDCWLACADELRPRINVLIAEFDAPSVGRALLRLAAEVAVDSFDLNDRDIDRLSQRLEHALVSHEPLENKGLIAAAPQLLRASQYLVEYVTIHDHAALEEALRLAQCAISEALQGG